MCRESRRPGEPIWRAVESRLSRELRFVLLVGIVVILCMGVLLFVVLLRAAFCAVCLVEPSYGDFFLGDDAAIFVFPDAKKKKGNRSCGDVHLGAARNSGFRLPAK